MPIGSASVKVHEIHVDHLAFFDAEDDAPYSRYPDAPLPPAITLERMQPHPGRSASLGRRVSPSIVRIGRRRGMQCAGSRRTQSCSYSSRSPLRRIRISAGQRAMPRPARLVAVEYGRRRQRFRGRATTAANSRTIHSANQFSTRRPGTRRNSRSLPVTTVRSAARACAAIRRSLGPIVAPTDSRWVRMLP